MTSVCIPATQVERRVSQQAAFSGGLVSQRPRATFLANSEPSLDDVMADDVVRRLMARDGVGVADLLSLIDRVRPHLG
jgi:hypothetical protein